MPDAILLQDVDQVGEKGAVVTVSKGYLRNYLIPRKLAAPATKGLVEGARRKAESAERAAADAVTQANELAALLNKTVLTIAQQAGEDGRLFGSVTNQDVADAIKEARGVTVDKRKVQLPDSIKAVGTYQVVVEIAEGIHAMVKTIITER
jgi:large subunit ribosomal protein L9